MIPIEELRRNIAGVQTSELEALRQMEAAAVAHLERLTNRYFGPPRETIEHVRSNDGYTLWLDGPIVSIATVDERTYIGGDATAIVEGESDGFVVRGDKLLRAGGLGWPYEYEVAYQQGYTACEEPDDVRRAVIELVRWLYQLRSAGGCGFLSETLGDYSYELRMGDDWRTAVPFAAQVVNTYKRIPV